MKIDINGNGGEFTVGGVDEKQIDFIYDKLKNSEETGDGRKHIDDTVFDFESLSNRLNAMKQFHLALEYQKDGITSCRFAEEEYTNRGYHHLIVRL